MSQGPHRFAFEVGTPVIQAAKRQPAAADAVVWPMEDPSRAIAIEAKRLRVDESTIATEQVGGVSAIKKCFRQALGHYRTGFSQSYVMVLLQVDARVFSGGSFPAMMLPAPLMLRIMDSVDAAVPDPRVGTMAYYLGSAAR